MALATQIRDYLLRIDPAETTFERRGFASVEPEKQQRLEAVGIAFVRGYRAAIESDHLAAAVEMLERVEREFRGFAYEGAAMGLALIDAFSPWSSRRVDQLLAGSGDAHAYMVHVGLGWAAARIPWRRRRILSYCKHWHPLYKWLIVDGYGFHQGYFYPERFVDKQLAPSHLNAYGRRAFDQGLGRSLWFVCGADVDRVAATVRRFAENRQADLYSGVGLACAYAGGADRAEVETLRAAAGKLADDMAQGAAFAAKARVRAGNAAAHTDRACKLLCGMTALQAAAVTDACLPHGACAAAAQPAYEVWRG